jgi:CheY-like chemotaxis protein
VGVARVLVVDDEEIVRLVCRDVLEARGHAVVEAGDGPEALAAYRRDRPDAVLLDVGLGAGADGLAVAEQIERLDPRARIVVMSGSRQTSLVRRAHRLGARDYLVKPFGAKDLAAAVERLLA